MAKAGNACRRASVLIFSVALLAVAARSAVADTKQIFQTAMGAVVVETIARGLEHPWSIEFLSRDRMLVSERPGRLRIVTRQGVLSPPIEGVPAVLTLKHRRQPGLLDIALDRNYRTNGTIYFCYVEPVADRGRIAVARALLIDEEPPRIEKVRTIFRAHGTPGDGNFGCRLVQTRDGNLFVSIGDYFQPRQAQRLETHLGAIVRIDPDGVAPPDNPFRSWEVWHTLLDVLDIDHAQPEIWSFGHRNPQGLAIHPVTGRLWANEHGPKGGDEINIVESGKNYGWPVIGYGIDYDGDKIHESTHKGGMEQPIKYWKPSIAPSGMTFYTGELFPAWHGDLFVGALVGRMLVRIDLDGETIVGDERLLTGLNERIRDVRQGPDGALWLVTDDPAGRVLRVAPAQAVAGAHSSPAQ